MTFLTETNQGHLFISYEDSNSLFDFMKTHTFREGSKRLRPLPGPGGSHTQVGGTDAATPWPS